MGEDFRATLHVKREWRSFFRKILPQTITIQRQVYRVRTLVKSEDYQGVKNEGIRINVINELFLITLHIPLLKIVYNIGLKKFRVNGMKFGSN